MVMGRGPRAQIAIPAQGLIEFKDQLAELLEQFGLPGEQSLLIIMLFYFFFIYIYICIFFFLKMQMLRYQIAKHYVLIIKHFISIADQMLVVYF